jgi:hypothetical protein
VIFQERLLKVLKCCNFLRTQRRHNRSPAASFANRVMTLYPLKARLQTFLSIPVTQKCQILSCDTLVADERYVVTYQKSLTLKGNYVRISNVIYVLIWRGAFFYLHYVVYYSFFILGIFVLLYFYIILFDHISFYFAPFDFVTIFIFIFYYILS